MFYKIIIHVKINIKWVSHKTYLLGFKLNLFSASIFESTKMLFFFFLRSILNYTHDDEEEEEDEEK